MSEAQWLISLLLLAVIGMLLMGALDLRRERLRPAARRVRGSRT